MAALTPLLGLQKGGAVAVVGCNGKTSLIQWLAKENEGHSVLFSPTTRILPPGPSPGSSLCTTIKEATEHTPHAGVQTLGVLAKDTSGKLNALPDAVLAQLVPRYHLSLLEADGSRGLPCKGWAQNEPVVPPYVTHTLGVVTLRPLGQPATQENVHRPDAFCALTGLPLGGIITTDVLARMAAAPGGMFKNSAGQRWLVVNGVTTPDGLAHAAELYCKAKKLVRFDFAGAVAGCTRTGGWRML